MRKQRRIHAGQHSYTDPLVLCQWCLQLNWKAKIWKPSGQNKILALCVSMSIFLGCVRPGSDNMHMSWLSCQRVERVVVDWPLRCKIILTQDTFIPYNHIMDVNHLTQKSRLKHTLINIMTALIEKLRNVKFLQSEKGVMATFILRLDWDLDLTVDVAKIYFNYSSFFIMCPGLFVRNCDNYQSDSVLSGWWH